MKRKIAKDGTAAAATITPARKRSTTATRKPAAAAAAKPRHIVKPSASAPAAHPKTGEKYESRTYTLDDYVVSYTNSLARGTSASAAAAASGGFQTARSLATKQPATAYHKPTVAVEAAEAKTEVIVIDSSDEDMAAASVSTSTKLSDAILPTAIGEGIRLDKMQHHIANLDIDKPLLIVAGAGSGKTTTLCARVIEMMRRGVMPASILVITFTNKAASELKERIAQYIEISKLDNKGQMPFASTFHSWCYGLVMRNHKKVGLQQCPMIAATETEHQALLRIALQRIDDCRMLVQCETMLDVPHDPASAHAEFRRGNESNTPVFVDGADKRWAAVAALTKERFGISVEQIVAQSADPPLAGAAGAKPAATKKKKLGAQTQTAADEMSITRAVHHYLYGKLGKKHKLADLEKSGDIDYIQTFGGKDAIGSIMAFIYRAKSRGDQPEQYPQFQGSVLRAYNATLERFNLLDFDDMLKIANDLLDVPEVLTSVRAEFRYLLVDEFQDLNQLQMSLVLKLQQGVGRVTAVGDERQSIYAFRGATCEHNFQMFLDWFVDAKVQRAQDSSDDAGGMLGAGSMESLTQNYRSHQSIVDLGNIVARDTIGDSSLLERLRVPLQALPSAPVVPVSIWNSDSHSAEATNITNKIKELIDSGDCKPSDIAVISRCLNFGSYSPTGLIEAGLMSKGIPYVVRGGHSALKSKRMQLFMALIRVVANTDDDIATQICLGDVVKSIGPVAMRKLLSIGGGGNSEEEMKPISLFAKMELAIQRGGILNKPATESLSAFVTSIRGWQSQLGSSTLHKLVGNMFQEFVSDTEDDDKSAPIWGKAAVASSSSKGATDNLWNMIEAILEGFLDSSSSSTALPPQDDDISSFAPERLANPRGPCTLMLLQAFSSQLCLLSTSSEDVGVVKGRGGAAAAKGKGKDKNNAVVITTVHQAKGLEWKHVFIPHFIECLFPMKFRDVPHADKALREGTKSTAKEAEVQHYREEGRLAYVAITRAKCGLYISVLAAYPMAWMEKFLGELRPSRYLPTIMCPPKNKNKHKRGGYGPEDNYY